MDELGLKAGVIVKGIDGFYYVESGEGTVYECRARGIFRKNHVTPLAGDKVEISVMPDNTGTICSILPRKNYFDRPPVANIDRLAMVVSVTDPKPNILVLDTIIALAESRNIEPALIFSKVDLKDASLLYEEYKHAGFECFCVSSSTGEGVSDIKPFLSGKVTAFAGNTGTGKSSLLNAVFKGLDLPTGETSKKLGRGRHTTRQVELLRTGGGGYAADTPGFSSIDISNYGDINKDNLQYFFREFRPYLGRCMFTSCSHTCEKGCGILQAVENGEISKSRHDSYNAIYRKIKELRKWKKE